AARLEAVEELACLRDRRLHRTALFGHRGHDRGEVVDERAQYPVGSVEGLGQRRGLTDQRRDRAVVALQGPDQRGGQIVDVVGIESAEQWLESVEQAGEIEGGLGVLEWYPCARREWSGVAEIGQAQSEIALSDEVL